MKITVEQEEAIEYLEKYTKWETFGERNLEKDMITILNLIDKLQEENEELKRKNEELKVLEDDIQDKNIAYIDEPEFKEKYISKKSLKDKIEKLLNKLTENPDYIAKIGNIEIGLAHKTKNSQTFYIYRDKKEREK